MCSVEDLLTISSMNTPLVVQTLNVIGGSRGNKYLTTPTVVQVLLEEDGILAMDGVSFLCILT
jgi:hypothetical protein